MSDTRKEPTALGKLIRQIRWDRKRMYQSSLESASGVSRGVIGDLERGWTQTTSPENLENLARGLGVPLDYLINPDKYLDAEVPQHPTPILELGDDEAPVQDKPLTFNIQISISGDTGRDFADFLSAATEFFKKRG